MRVRVVADLQGTRGEHSSPKPRCPTGRRETHQRGSAIAAGGRGAVELRGHEVQAGVGARPSHVPIDSGVSHAEGVGALHAQRGPQAQGCGERWCQRMGSWVWGCARCSALLTQGVHGGFGCSGAELWGTAGSRCCRIALRCGGAGLEAGCPCLLHLLGQNNVTSCPPPTPMPSVIPPSLNPARYKGSPLNLQASPFTPGVRGSSTDAHGTPGGLNA